MNRCPAPDKSEQTAGSLANPPLGLQLYRGVAAVAGLTAWPWLYWRLRSRGYGASFRPRLGLQVPDLPQSVQQPRVWLHGVSVGEIAGAAPLVRELQHCCPQADLVFSTSTETGQAVARRLFGPIGPVFYYPVDTPWAVRRLLRHVRPALFVCLETEIWPNFLLTAKAQGVRLALVNGRLSDRSFRNYLRIKQQLSYILDLFSVVATGSAEDSRRFICLGADPARVVCTGNTKFDRWPDAASQEQAHSFRQRLALADQPVFLAASTHPGEDEIVLAAYQDLRRHYPALLLLLAPRHPERAGAVGQLAAAAGLAWERWQPLKAETRSRQAPVVIIDTVGDLFSLYEVADLVFVGGSLVPRGGQNILEPAVWGKVPLFGPHLENFRAAQRLLADAGAGLQIQDAASLAAQGRRLLADPAERQRLGERGRLAVQQHRGAARRQAELLAPLLR